MITANRYFRDTFGHKMYKASIAIDVSCPNRDGSKGTGGCIFCSEGGSGEFAARGEKTVTWLAGFAFGVFLTHNPIRLYLMRIMGSWNCARQLKILILWAAVLVLGFAAAWVISLIPKAGNYLIYRKAQKTKQA